MKTHALINKALTFAKRNKSLFFLFFILLLTSQFKQNIQLYVDKLDNPSLILSIFIYTLLGTFLMPTVPLNISYGLIFGKIQATIITLISTCLIMLIQITFRRIIPLPKSDPDSFMNKLRDSSIAEEIKILIVRLNPFLPLPIASGLLKGKSLKIKFKLLFFSLIGTFPAAYLLSQAGYEINNLTFYNSFLNLLMLIILSLPTLLLRTKNRIFLKKFISNKLFK